MTTIKDYENLLCLIFSPSVAAKGQKELENLMDTLLNHFPYEQKAEDHKTPYPVDSAFAKKWFAAYNHLILLIESKKQGKRYSISLIISVVAITLSILGLLTK